MENYHFHWEPPLRFGLLNCLPPKETNHTNHRATNKITLGHGKQLKISFGFATPRVGFCDCVEPTCAELENCRPSSVSTARGATPSSHTHKEELHLDVEAT